MILLSLPNHTLKILPDSSPNLNSPVVENSDDRARTIPNSLV